VNACALTAFALPLKYRSLDIDACSGRTSQGSLVAAIAALAFVSGCSTSTATGDVKVLDYGIYDAVVALRGSRALGQTPEIASVAGLRHRTTTRTVPCLVNTYFGLRLDPASLPPTYHLKTEIQHPPFAMPQGESSTIDVEEFDVPAEGDLHGALIWYFLEGFEYEMVPGKWSFKIFINDKLVAEQEFNAARSL